SSASAPDPLPVDLDARRPRACRVAASTRQEAERSMAKKPRKTVDALLEERRELVEQVAAIDAELCARGVRPIQTVIGRPRAVAELICRALSEGPRTSAQIQEMV